MTVSSPESLTGPVEKIIFHDVESGFCVLLVKAKGRKEVATVVGYVLRVEAGDFIQASGAWLQDRKYGLQFKSEFLTVTAPTTMEGIEKYLASGLIKGIGPFFAKKLMEAFGETVFQVIEEEPDRLNKISGIGPSRAEKIIKSWADQKVIRDIMVFLHSHGISTARSVRIYKTYGAASIQVMTENPYRLARDIHGVGFISADKIAEKLGIEKTSSFRAQAGILYALTTVMKQGHCGYPVEKLLDLCQELLDIPRDLIQEALTRGIQEREVVQASLEGTPCVFLRFLYCAEKSLAEKIVALREGPLPWPSIPFKKAIQDVEQETSLTLSESQKHAIQKVLCSKVMIITGGPGVGKTTLVNSLLKILHAQNLKISLCAPTGRAAKRLSESTGYEAKTIHRLLETSFGQGGFTKNEDSPLASDVLVVDEMSMVDVPLMDSLLKALPPKAALFMVGDRDQLPSVGPGQVLASLIDSKAFPVIQLTEVFRQAAESTIIRVAHQINEGVVPSLDRRDKDSDFYFVEVEDPETALSKIVSLVTQKIPEKFGVSPLHDIQVLCPMGRGLVGTKTLTAELQKVLNPPSAQSLQRFGCQFSVGDKVMQIQNNYEKEVYNGDIGFIRLLNSEEFELTITFDNRDVVYGFDELDEIILAYAITIHKSQGSEYPVIVVPLMMQHYIMLQRNLIYTAITRGKKLVIVVGQRKALAMAVQNKKDQNRITLLTQSLSAAEETLTLPSL